MADIFAPIDSATIERASEAANAMSPEDLQVTVPRDEVREALYEMGEAFADNVLELVSEATNDAERREALVRGCATSGMAGMLLGLWIAKERTEDDSDVEP